MKLQLQDGKYTKYISFTVADLGIRLETLNLNNIRNMEKKYEILEVIDITNTVTIRKNNYQLKDYLLAIKVEKMNLFITIKQGEGKYSSDIIVIISPKVKIEVRK